MASRKAKDPKATENEFQFADATPFTVWRSDGTEMPSEYNHYEKVEEGAKPIFEWQNKLGQALAAELMPGASGQFFLAEFPTHYHLRWYQAKEDNKKNQAKHYYLFGYPEESAGANKARKYYRSPNQFLPHLLWLLGDSNDRGDCACEFCSGSKPITSKAAKTKAVSSAGQAPSPAPTSAPPTTSINVPAPSANVGPPTTKSTNPPATAASTSNPKPRTVARPAASSQQSAIREAQTSAPSQVSEATTSVPTVTTGVATSVSHDHAALFRAGEVVWFKNNNAWRVGMVITSAPSTHTLSIIPFGHPLYRTQEVTKEESDVRPFLAFSIPQIAPALQELKGRALAQINWESLQERFNVRSDPSRQEALAVEATKLAAARVDQCYSMFNAAHHGSMANYDIFGGVFLGAEKICVGEPVRIKLPREQQEQSLEEGMPVVMVVRRILISRDSKALMFEGSLWRLQHAALTQPGPNQGQGQLPTAMLGEKEFRDGLLQESGWRVDWLLMNQNMMVSESTIRGRFYETRRLTPILNPAKFQDMLRTRQVPDIQTSLNNRGDSNGPSAGRVPTRAYAVAGAVPPGIPASLGPDVVEA